MKRSTAMILTIVSILLCGCPGLAFCAGGVYALTINQQTLLEGIRAQGFKLPDSGNLPAELMTSKIILMIIALVLIAIPIIVGLITLRKPKGAKKQPVVASMPVSTPPARPPMQPPHAMVSTPAPVHPVYVPPAPAPKPEPLPPVYEPPAPAPEPEPLPPVYVPPAPAPEPLPPVYVSPAPELEPEPLPPAPAAFVTPPEEQPEEPAQQVFATVEMSAPPMMEEATRLASNWCLVFVSGPSPVNTITLAKKISLGRSPENDVIVADPLISRQHAIVESIGGGYQVTDLNSANGTFLNETPVTTPVRLHVGDLVKFGGTVFRFQPSYEMK